MSELKQKVELLAPAGSLEAFLGAIHAGADAVYVGGEKFSARAYADNLNTENLCSCIRYAHLFGRRVYLTLNTLIKESEFSEIYDFVRPLYDAGLDGVILQDFGVLSLLRREFPGLLLHASTQMAITGPDIVPWCQEHSISRIVPARELSLKELKEIKDAGIEVECFIHGAMCYCYSGMCLMSSILGGRSGNRGRCAQPCRLPYDAEGDGFHTRESYPLSLKDMCTIDHLPQLIEAGMSSFKIEGRMKRSEYAAGVTAVYRKYIDLYFAHPDQPFSVSADDREILNRLYIRSDAQDGYLFRHNGCEMVTGAKPGYEEVPQELLDRIRHKHLEQRLSYPVSMRAEFCEGEAAKLYLETDRLEISVDGPVAEHAKKLPSDEASVRKQLAKLGNTDFTLRSLDITIRGDIFLPNGMLNQLRRDGIAKLEDSIIKRFFPELEQRRRSSDDKLSNGADSVLPKYLHESQVNARPARTSVRDMEHRSTQSGLSVLVSRPEQLQVCLTHPILERLKLIYISEECLNELEAVTGQGSGKETAESASGKNRLLKMTGSQKTDYIQADNCVLALPYIARVKDRAHLTDLISQARGLGIHRLLVRNLEELGLIRQLSMDREFELIADASLYCWNKEAKTLLLQDFEQVTLPYELNSRESRDLTDACTERIIYGYIPLMVSANCLYRTNGTCRIEQSHSKAVPAIGSDLSANTFNAFISASDGGNAGYRAVHGQAVLTDRLHKRFTADTDCRYCYNTIYNSVPMSLHNKIDRIQGQNVRLQFTLETAEETVKILDYYRSRITDADDKKPACFPCSEFTTAHENRQVE